MRKRLVLLVTAVVALAGLALWQFQGLVAFQPATGVFPREQVMAAFLGLLLLMFWVFGPDLRDWL